MVQLLDESDEVVAVVEAAVNGVVMLLENHVEQLLRATVVALFVHEVGGHVGLNNLRNFPKSLPTHCGVGEQGIHLILLGLGGSSRHLDISRANVAEQVEGSVDHLGRAVVEEDADCLLLAPVPEVRFREVIANFVEGTASSTGDNLRGDVANTLVHHLLNLTEDGVLVPSPPEILLLVVPVKLEPTEVEVGSVTPNLLCLDDAVGGEDLATELRVGSGGGVDEELLSGVDVRLHELIVAREEQTARLREPVHAGPDVLVVDERVGADVEDAGASDALVEMNLGMNQHELVAVLGGEELSQRAHPERGLLAVDAAEALVEEATDGALADPVGLVGVEGAVGRHAPLVRVLVVVDANECAVDVLLRVDGALDTTREVHVVLGEAAADDRIVALVENGSLVLRQKLE